MKTLNWLCSSSPPPSREFIGANIDLRRDVPKLIALAAATGRE